MCSYLVVGYADHLPIGRKCQQSCPSTQWSVQHYLASSGSSEGWRHLPAMHPAWTSACIIVWLSSPMKVCTPLTGKPSARRKESACTKLCTSDDICLKDLSKSPSTPLFLERTGRPSRSNVNRAEARSKRMCPSLYKVPRRAAIQRGFPFVSDIMYCNGRRVQHRSAVNESSSNKMRCHLLILKALCPFDPGHPSNLTHGDKHKPHAHRGA